jgi:hypothetical protein
MAVKLMATISLAKCQCSIFINIAGKSQEVLESEHACDIDAAT